MVEIAASLEEELNTHWDGWNTAATLFISVWVHSTGSAWTIEAVLPDGENLWPTRGLRYSEDPASSLVDRWSQDAMSLAMFTHLHRTRTPRWGRHGETDELGTCTQIWVVGLRKSA